MNAPTEIRYLTEAETRQLCASFDAVEAVREALVLHASDRATVASEAHMRWKSPAGHAARTLNMPGHLDSDRGELIGTKVINASLGNVDRGLPRASGLTMLFDPETARVTCVMASAYISALRTACVTVAAAEALQPASMDKCAILGAGTLAQMHAELIASRFPQLKRIEIFDLVPAKAQALAEHLRRGHTRAGLEFTVASSSQEAVDDTALVVPVTTTTQGYIPHSWLRPGAVVVHVSLDDLLPDAVLLADRLFVDDWALVRDDPHRLLGRMYREGLLAGPGDRSAEGVRRVDAVLGSVLSSRAPGRLTDDDIIVVNPFGMSIEDVAIAARVHEQAVEQGIGHLLTR
ncbi:ornithine cyclodeaminase [Streptomyces sp. NPDC046805]|uniref:ornithine cyclodeaminase family protein n=1 Tax=Streptomyces sp. NPDC046805 TaxID=3155134 RepID=UPI0033CF575F